jgi:hypothetical protein
LKLAQEKIVDGRQLELESECNTIEGKVNYIMVDRNNLLEITFSEIAGIWNLRTTLEVQFYEELSNTLYS